LLFKIKQESQSVSPPYAGVKGAVHKFTTWSWGAKNCCHLTEPG